MTELLTAAQMRAIEKAAIDSGEVTGLELMERAGRGVVEAVFEEWPELAQAPHKAVVLCGPGNNGGDGCVVARLLKEWGWEVEVFLYGDVDKLPPDARVNCDRWCELGNVRQLGFPTLSEDDEQLLYHAVWVGKGGERRVVFDALFGTGLDRPITGLLPYAQLFDHSFGMDSSEGLSIIAVDLPSGFSTDTGAVVGEDDRLAFFADLTVTFHHKKKAHDADPCKSNCGHIVVKDIDL